MPRHDIAITLPSGLVLDPGPEPMEFAYWQADIPSNVGEITMTVVVESPDTADDLDLAFIGSIAADVDTRLAQAALAVQSQLTTSGIFGLLDTQRHELLAGPPDELPLAHPELTFWVGDSWMIRFASVEFPACGELGIGVDFTGEIVTGVENLDDAEEF